MDCLIIPMREGIEVWDFYAVIFLVTAPEGFKAVVPVSVLLFVALWFILRGDLLYVFPCVILFLCFSVLLVLRLPRLGKRELILVLFVHLFGCACLDLSVSSSSWGLGRASVCNCHSLDFSLTFFGITGRVIGEDINRFSSSGNHDLFGHRGAISTTLHCD